MKMLMCHDGSHRTGQSLRFASLIARACHADVTLLGIAESEGADAHALIQHLQDTRKNQEIEGLSPQVLAKTGSAVEEILDHGDASRYDLVVIGAGQSHEALLGKTYELLRQINSTVLLVIGERPELRKILICSSGADYTEEPIHAVSGIAQCTQAPVTLLHVAAEAPLMYSDIIAREEDAEQLLESDSMLGTNLRRQKQMLEKLGIHVTMRLRRGDVADQVIREARESDIDLIAVGSTVDRGPVYRYLLGDVTQQIINRATCPVLIARQKKGVGSSLWSWLTGNFSRSGGKQK